MSMGPVEILAVTFPPGASKRQLVPALAELIANGTVRVIDLLFVRKGFDGEVEAFELEQAGEDEAAFGDLDGEVGDMLTQEDIAAVAAELEPGGSAAMLVWENVWASRFAAAVRNAGGEVQLNLRVPHDMIEAALTREAVS